MAVKADFSCNICDFQIAKDVDAIISDAQIPAPQYGTILFFIYIISAYGSDMAFASGTDPPLFA